MLSRRCSTVIVGGGPAALAPLISASHSGRLGDILAGGVVLIEQGPVIGLGRLGDYSIWSDSTALTFLSAITDDSVSGLAALRRHPIYEELTQIAHGAIPLVKAAELMGLIGEVLHAAIVGAGGSVLVNHKAIWARQHADGWLVSAHDNVGNVEKLIDAKHLVLATGGHQPLKRLESDPVAGEPLLPKFGDKLIRSDEALQLSGAERIFARMREQTGSHVAIVGGSTSALATADMLLRRRPDLFAAPGSIKIVHKRPLRVFYRSREEALAENYVDFTEDDVCPISGFVYRLAGFRLHSRDLLLRILEIGGREKEVRAELHRVDPDNFNATQELLKTSVAIVAATGYRPRALPLRDDHDQDITILAETDRAPLVDGACRILDRNGTIVSNAYGIGLAAGFVPSGKLGGEKSFIGQANGLWLWQTAVGAIIIDQILAGSAAVAHDQRDAFDKEVANARPLVSA